MTRPTLPRALLTAALACALASPLVGAPAQAKEPAPTTKIKPGAIKRGDDIGVPYVRRRTIVDGDRTITVDAPYVRLLGKAGADYVVHIANAQRQNSRIVRVAPDGTTSNILRKVDGLGIRLNSEGTRLAKATVEGNHTSVKEWSAETGAFEVLRSFQGTVSILDFTGSTLLLGGTAPARTFTFDFVSLETTKVLNRQGYAADVAADRLATYTGDPYAGGCTVVTKLSRPRVELWRSCRQRVDSFSPTGRRVATVALLADGIGPSVVRVLASRGRTLAKYTIDGWFGQLRWENDKRLLLDANGRKQFAVVRCVQAECERATGLSPAQSPRTR